MPMCHGDCGVLYKLSDMPSQNNMAPYCFSSIHARWVMVTATESAYFAPGLAMIAAQNRKSFISELCALIQTR
jgi:hypothetical protein